MIKVERKIDSRGRDITIYPQEFIDEVVEYLKNNAGKSKVIDLAVSKFRVSKGKIYFWRRRAGVKKVTYNKQFVGVMSPALRKDIEAKFKVLLNNYSSK